MHYHILYFKWVLCKCRVQLYNCIVQLVHGGLGETHPLYSPTFARVLSTSSSRNVFACSSTLLSTPDYTNLSLFWYLSLCFQLGPCLSSLENPVVLLSVHIERLLIEYLTATQGKPSKSTREGVRSTRNHL